MSRVNVRRTDGGRKIFPPLSASVRSRPGIIAMDMQLKFSLYCPIRPPPPSPNPPPNPPPYPPPPKAKPPPPPPPNQSMADKAPPSLLFVQTRALARTRLTCSTRCRLDRGRCCGLFAMSCTQRKGHTVNGRVAHTHGQPSLSTAVCASARAGSQGMGAQNGQEVKQTITDRHSHKATKSGGGWCFRAPRVCSVLVRAAS